MKMNRLAVQLAFVTTTSESFKQIKLWIDYHKSIGVNHFYLYVDGQVRARSWPDFGRVTAAVVLFKQKEISCMIPCRPHSARSQAPLAHAGCQTRCLSPAQSTARRDCGPSGRGPEVPPCALAHLERDLAGRLLPQALQPRAVRAAEPEHGRCPSADALGVRGLNLTSCSTLPG